ncbi:RagB/SusD family nutrient uptake outer membrane protein [Hymenobacter busanensis]|uniref:RagB/SusD family nutrient uptake outer membrane protein n=2 Tax=Hymenobacter busanensis TaxID=2607656 RepID=A0A7L5A3Q6_9BACT|nr:RagB/SusD family nutrient uptake outer membrane protein [Hymenobacter busanensis]QHJ09795.1 RagB/SusD family nutrient uptake outer membrane protein [Hymenobacter busanensis]
MASGLLLALPGCDKALEEYNPSGLTAENVYTTPAGFESLVNGAYSYSRWWYGKEDGYSMSEMGTDLWLRGAGDVNPDLTDYATLQSSSRAVTELWTQFYAAVNVCNAGISYVGKSGLPDDRKLVREGELRFLRAFYLWHIVEQWGGVHLSTSPTTTVQTTAQRTSVDGFYKQIFEDLDFAVANLPATPPADYGRANKAAAEALLAKMHLTRGEAGMPDAQLHNQKAATLAEHVISAYGLALQPVYADLWTMSNLQNKEVVWAVNYSKDLSMNDLLDASLYPGGHPRGSNNGHLLFLMKYDDQPGMTRDTENGRPFNRFMPTRFLLNLFDDAKDARYDASFKSVWYTNAPVAGKLAKGDTAILATKRAIPAAVAATKKYVIWDVNRVYNAAGRAASDRLHYVTLKKFDDPTRATFNEAQSSRDAYVIRLSDMYLTAAEAYLKLGNTGSAVPLINAVRRRAAKPGQQTAMEISAAQVTLDFILDERAREFAGEQLRWFDLKRTGKLVDRVRANNPEAGASIQNYHVVRPIPQRQLDAITNKEEFKQNSDYR